MDSGSAGDLHVFPVGHNVDGPSLDCINGCHGWNSLGSRGVARRNTYLLLNQTDRCGFSLTVWV